MGETSQVVTRDEGEMCSYLPTKASRRIFTWLSLCASLSAVCLFSMDSLAAPLAKPTAAPSVTPVGRTAPIKVKMKDICCHVGLFTRRKAKDPMIDRVKEEVVAQGDYFKVPVVAASSPASDQAKCEEVKKEIFEVFLETAATAVPREYDFWFKQERDKGVNLEALNTPIHSEEEVIAAPGELWDTITYARTTLYTLKATFAERCEPMWCGVEGSLDGETEDTVPVPEKRSIIRRTTAGYRFFSTLTERIDKSALFDRTYWSKGTWFSFPVTKVGPRAQCNCTTLVTSVPPSHTSELDQELPWRDWIAPPDKIATDGKYSKGLCPAQ